MFSWSSLSQAPWDPKRYRDIPARKTPIDKKEKPKPGNFLICFLRIVYTYMYVGQKKASDPLELGLQTIVSCPVVGNSRGCLKEQQELLTAEAV